MRKVILTAVMATSACFGMQLYSQKQIDSKNICQKDNLMVEVQFECTSIEKVDNQILHFEQQTLDDDDEQENG